MTSLFFKRKPVTVVDSIMGSGKTSWAIQHMNDNLDKKKFMFVTPYLKESQRIIHSTYGAFKEPEVKGGKMNNLKKLIAAGNNVVCTHELLKNCDKELIELIKSANYTLILDEVMDVINEMDQSKDDIEMLFNLNKDTGLPTITVNTLGKVTWNYESYVNGKYENIRNAARSGNLMSYNNEKLYWVFPVDIFEAFKEVYILTYMFQGQSQCYYYEMFNINFIYKSVKKINDSYQLTDYVDHRQEDRSHFKKNINIYNNFSPRQNDLNEIGEKFNALSKSNFKEESKNKSYIKTIKNNCVNYQRHKTKVTTDKVIWTTYKDFKKILCPRGFAKRFVAMNARATNDYADANTCIYLVNRYMHPYEKHFFTSRGIKVDAELFALSELLQWLFRSAIRNGEEINVYIPSKRMRTLLERYLNNEI